MRRNKILISALEGFSFRNILYSGMLRALSKQADVVVSARSTCCPSVSTWNEFAGSAEVRPVEHFEPQLAELHSVARRIFWTQTRAFRARNLTETVRVKRAAGIGEFRPRSWKEQLGDRALKTALTSAVSHVLDEMLDRFVLHNRAARAWTQLLEREEFDMLYLPSFLFHEDWVMASVARRAGVQARLGVLSWDNLSSKGRIPGRFERYLVWSPHMKEELCGFYPEIDAGKVTQSGALQFDFHHQEKWTLQRRDFCEEKGLDPERPFLFYGGCTPGLAPDEHRIVQALLDACEHGRLKGTGLQLYVRLHPKDDGERYAGIAHRSSNVVLDHPNQTGNLKTWTTGPHDIFNLVNSIRHAAVVCTMGSTITLDAIVQDRPVINVDFQPGKDANDRCPGQLNYQYTHFIPVVRSGASPIVKSVDELVAQVNAYLHDPSIHAPERKNLRQRLCGPTDGKNFSRTADALLAT